MRCAHCLELLESTNYIETTVYQHNPYKNPECFYASGVLKNFVFLQTFAFLIDTYTLIPSAYQMDWYNKKGELRCVAHTV
jgi:hypothetical protein